MRVLLLEDDGRLRSELARVLRKRRHEVVEAGSLAALDAHVDPIGLDGAVVDLRLPDGSGLDAVRALLRRNSQVRIVVMTGYGSIASALEAVREGAVDYLTKPADADQLLAALGQEWLSGEPNSGARVPSLQRVEWEHIQRVLRDNEGNVSRAARALGIHRRTLQRKLSYPPPGS